MKRSVLASLLFMLNSPAAHATMTTEACIDAHVASQQLRAASKLLEARDALAQCGSAECPGVLRSECGAWLDEVNQQTPSIVPVVVTPEGADVSVVKLVLDGTSRSIQPGASTSVDPGPHELVAMAEGFESATLPFTAKLGERNRRLEATLVPIQKPAPIWPYFAFGGGVALGVGAFAGMGALARADEKDLQSCEPNCSDGAIGKVGREYILANVGLGVAAASLAGAGAYFLFTRSSIFVRPETTGSMVYYSTQF